MTRGTVRLRISTIALTLMVGMVRVVMAQQTGIVTGKAVDQTGGALPGITIDLFGGKTELTTVTDGTGGYRFDSVPTGPAELTFRRINLSVVRRSVSVVAAQPPTAEVVMML